jgi:hypothetical protein
MINYKYLIGSSLGNTRLEDFYQKADEPPPNAASKSARVVQWSNSFIERVITLGVKVGEGPLPRVLRRCARYARRERKQKRSQKNLAQCPVMG